MFLNNVLGGKAVQTKDISLIDFPYKTLIDSALIYIMVAKIRNII
jgi:hypothetical protein